MDKLSHTIFGTEISRILELELSDKEIAVLSNAPDLDNDEGIHRVTWHRYSKIEELYIRTIMKNKKIFTKFESANILMLSHLWLDMFTAPVFALGLRPSFYWKISDLRNLEWIKDLYDITFEFEKHNVFHEELKLFFTAELDRFLDVKEKDKRLKFLTIFFENDLDANRIFSKTPNTLLAIRYGNLFKKYTDKI